MAKAREGRERRWGPRGLIARALAAGAVVAIAVLGPASSRGVMASQDTPSTGKGKKYVATRDITVDKATGALRKPTDVETQELVDTLTGMLKGSAEAPTPVTLRTGAISASLESHAAPVMLARPNPDGATEVRCVTSFEEALDFLGLVEAPAQQ